MIVAGGWQGLVDQMYHELLQWMVHKVSSSSFDIPVIRYKSLDRRNFFSSIGALEMGSWSFFFLDFAFVGDK